MIRTILVPLDGSRFAEAALPLAVRLARAAHADVQLLMAHQPSYALTMAGVPEWGTPEDPEKRARAQTYLAETAACLPVSGAPIAYELVEGGVDQALAERIGEHPPDLVVMATHGRGTIGRFWHGSVADYLVRHVSVPMLLVRPDRQARLGASTGFRSILVPLDFSAASEMILEPVTALARVTQAHLTLIHIVEPVFDLGVPSSAEADAANAERNAAQRQLDRAAAQLRQQGFSVATRVFSGAGVAGLLLSVLREGSFDLVALTTHGRGGVKRAVLGSVATRLLVEAPQPVLVLRPRMAL